MNQSTKQRVVGTFVLLALALIFLPLVVDGDGQYQPTINPGLVSAEPKLDELSLPEGWSVRLGVFSDSANAVSLTRRLLDAGYRAYSRDIPGAQGVATGVFVGPHVDRGEANLLKDRLQDEFQLAGLVVRFEVDSI